MSPTPRPPAGHDRFLEVELPQRFVLQFLTDRGTWMDEAVCLGRQFVRNPDGSYLCTSFSSALWIRCVAQHEDHFEHVDGGGRHFRYRILPLPMVDESVVPTIHL